MESTRGIKIFYGALNIGFVACGIHSYHVGEKFFEWVRAATHIQQPFIGQDF
jgi:hypothetical protein